MADLFSIIVLMEHLEKAFIRDSITADEYVVRRLFVALPLSSLTIDSLPSRYTPQCANLIAKYKTALNFLSDTVTDLESFMAKYKVKDLT
jgi:ESCRT-I complex subunit VPS28